MALDRWIALAFIGVCIAYGYAAFFTMDQLLPPFMQSNPVWPSTFPKVLSVLGAIVGLVVLLGLEKPADKDPSATDINYRRLGDYHIGQALMLLGLMVVYALALRPFGFLPATILFVVGGSFILGERRWGTMILSAVLVGYIVWFLVQVLLEIYLLPLPYALSDANSAFIDANEAAWEATVAVFESLGGATEEIAE